MKQEEHFSKSVVSQIRSGLGFSDISMSDGDMLTVAHLMKKYAGISLPADGKTLVLSRLMKRIHFYQLGSMGEYLSLLESGRYLQERSLFVDALTTNETYFFREPAHFDFLSRSVVPVAFRKTSKLRVWSAAASEGQEAYSIAMALESTAGYMPWEVFGSDINRQVIDTASNAIYPMERLDAFPEGMLKKYCLKGSGPMDGYLAIAPIIRDRVSFGVLNLNGSLPIDLGRFDAIFLRNILIYFDKVHQTKIINNVLSKLKQHGFLFLGISEHIDPQPFGLKQVQKSIFTRIDESGTLQ